MIISHLFISSWKCLNSKFWEALISFTPPFHSSLCLFKTFMLMICHIWEMCDWQTRACGWSGVVLMSPDEREPSSGYSRKIHSWEEWKQRHATPIDCWCKVRLIAHITHEALPAKQILKTPIWSAVFSPHGRELIFRSDEMRTMFCFSQTTVRHVSLCGQLWRRVWFSLKLKWLWQIEIGLLQILTEKTLKYVSVMCQNVPEIHMRRGGEWGKKRFHCHSKRHRPLVVSQATQTDICSCRATFRPDQPVWPSASSAMSVKEEYSGDLVTHNCFSSV